MTAKIDIERIDELIAGYFAQGLNKDELAELQQWLKASVENKSYFLQAQELWFSAISANHAVRFDSKKAFQRFLASTIIVTQTNETETEIQTKYNKRFFELSFVRVAAAVALLIVFTGIGFQLGNGHSFGQLADVKVEAPYGSKTKMYLPDGTLVWLNAGSTLSYSQDFGVDNRQIVLVGEGYFEVTKNKNLPFNVKTNEMTVRVLGTKFNFRNYTDEDEASVSLIEGKVQLNDNINDSNRGFVLIPNQQAVFDKTNKNITVNRVKATYSSDWTKGLISFDEEKLSNIAHELERLYNVQITIADDSLLNYRFYGNFTRTEQSIEDVLNVLASTNKLKFEQKGKEITLHSK
jgi:ferric-dicitrate binding protein FerR (iron transport regulator)